MQATSLNNEFLSSEFDGRINSLPFAQVLNDKRKSDCGFFITADNLMAADWQFPDEQRFHTVTWGSGEEEDGLLIHNPRLIILSQSPLLMYERSTDLNIGIYDPNYYRRNKKDVLLKSKYLIYFLDESNQPRHTTPMQLTLKSTVGATFGEHLQKFRMELEKAFAVAHKQPVRRKNNKFHAMGVFCIETEPQLKGDDQKSWACITINHEKPTEDNWLNYFVGFTPLKERLWADLDSHSEFGQIKSVEPVKPAPELKVAVAHSDEDEVVAKLSLFPAQPAITTSATNSYASATPAEDEMKDEVDSISF